MGWGQEYSRERQAQGPQMTHLREVEDPKKLCVAAVVWVRGERRGRAMGQDPAHKPMWTMSDENRKKALKNFKWNGGLVRVCAVEGSF